MAASHDGDAASGDRTSREDVLWNEQLETAVIFGACLFAYLRTFFWLGLDWAYAATQMTPPHGTH